ncbi:unnamed protein product, partial [Rotaria socialis]
MNLASPEDGIIENDEVTVQTAGPQHIDNFINSSLLKFPKNENSNNALPQHCILESDLPNEVECMSVYDISTPIATSLLFQKQNSLVSNFLQHSSSNIMVDNIYVFISNDFNSKSRTYHRTAQIETCINNIKDKIIDANPISLAIQAY